MNNDNRPFYKSATKLVFVMLAVALIVGMFVGKVESKDFYTLVSQVFAFYFGQKINQLQNQLKNNTPQNTDIQEP